MNQRRQIICATVAILAAGLTGCSQDTAADLEPPGATDPVRAWNQSIVSCLQNEGWPDAEVDADGAGYSVPSVTGAQREAFQATNATCRMAAGPAPNEAPLSDEQIDMLYDHLVASVECIENFGYTPPTDAPSREAFRGQYRSGNAPWSPFLDLPEMTEEQETQFNLTCPQVPADLHQ